MSENQTSTAINFETQPKLQLLDPVARPLHIGLVGNYPDTEETRFLLTPEGCGLVVSAGNEILMEAGAATDISFPDDAYTEYGVKISTRDEALKSDIVLSYAPLRVEDIQKMKNGGTLLTMMDDSMFDAKVVKALLEKSITAGCLDNMYSSHEMAIFADIVDEIDGRASIIYAQEFLSYVGGGKGVLLAGVAGLNPCEVLIIGDGTVAYSAAKAAMKAGAYVTLMNNDISALQIARRECGEGLNTIAIHPHVLYNKVKSADVILLGTCTRNFEFPKNLSVVIKDSAYILNFNETKPSLSVPRTVAMAISNVLVNFFGGMSLKGGIDPMIAGYPGVQSGIVTYKGKLVDKLVASCLNMPSVDLKVMIAATN